MVKINRLSWRGMSTLTVAMALAASAAEAMDPRTLPSGGRVVVGNAGISQTTNTLTVDQTSQRAVLNWQNFDIGASATVNFNQPGSTAVALNRIVGSDASQIYGRLNATGHVFFINPNGMLFAQGSQVNVGGILATTLSLGDRDFMAGNYRFASPGNGSIDAQGNITATGSAVLIGNTVRNSGQITASTVVLAAGNMVAVDLTGDGLLRARVDDVALKASIENSGSITGVAAVTLTAGQAKSTLDRVVNNSGVIRATGLAEMGGDILLSGSMVANTGLISASGQKGGGRIKLMGDMSGGTVQVGGKLDASAPVGGDGGFIETSAAHVLVAKSASIVTRAARGKNGTWLIDPTDFTIAASGGDITGDELGANLESGNVVILSADGLVEGGGSIFVNDGVGWSGGNTLTLSAVSNIAINAPISASSGTLKLITGGGGAAQTAPITVAALELQGSSGDFALNDGGNSVGVLAGNAKSLSFTNSGDFEIGTVGDTIGVSTSAKTTLLTGGKVTQTQAISASELELQGSGASFILNNASNSIDTLTLVGGQLSMVGSVGTLNLAGGSIGDAGLPASALTVTRAFNWSDGSLGASTQDTVTLASGASGTVTAGDKTLNALFTNNGNLSLAAGAAIDGTGLLNNSGTIDAQGGRIAVGFDNTGTLNVNTGSLDATAFAGGTNRGRIVLASGTTLSTNADLLNAGSVTGDGTLDVGATNTLTNEGTLSPGNSGGTGTLNIAGNLVNNGTIAIKIGGPKDHDVLAVSGTAALGGKLSTSLINGFAPMDDSFDVIVASAISGSFATQDIPVGTNFSVVVTTNTLTIVAAAAGSTPTPPTLEQCIADPALAGCTAILPTAATCAANPASPGCSIVLAAADPCKADPASAECEAVTPPTVSQIVGNRLAPSPQTQPSTPAATFGSNDNGNTAATRSADNNDKGEAKPVFQTVVIANNTVQKPADQVMQVEQPKGRGLVCR